MIRRAENRDIPSLDRLLLQVLAVHAQGRPDIFKPGTKKYTDAELEALIADDSTPIYVYDDGEVRGYAFCAFQFTPETNNMHARRSIYIDDLCVDAAARGKGIGRSLFEHVKRVAAEADCAAVTLNVWALNPGAYEFYVKMGLQPLKTLMEMKLL